MRVTFSEEELEICEDKVNEIETPVKRSRLSRYDGQMCALLTVLKTLESISKSFF